MKRKINENQKITLTIGQLKRLVKESVSSNNGTLYKNNDIPYSRVFSVAGYSDIRIFSANDKEGFISYLISEIDIREDMAEEIANHAWKLKPQESYLNCTRLM